MTGSSLMTKCFCGEVMNGCNCRCTNEPYNFRMFNFGQQERRIIRKGFISGDKTQNHNMSQSSEYDHDLFDLAVFFFTLLLQVA